MERLIFALILTYLKWCNCYIIHIKYPDVNTTGTNITSHLNYSHIQRICNNRYICKSNNTQICAVRKLNDDFEFKIFENSCYLFLDNMCDNPGREFSIAGGGDCTEHKSRRMYVYSGVGETTSTTKEAPVPENSTKSGNSLRLATFSTMYDIDTAFDYHICPLRCTDEYAPVCVSANRGFGKFFKFWTFVNHCSGDLYYCQHWQDFSPPPDEDENVNSSPLSWSYCAASRYLQFARFAETTSAMGHYGWLEGDYRYSHILEPHERRPGFG